MTFITGLFLIDTPASALNNLGNIQGEADNNIVGVKLIHARDGAYPYVSAQAFRYWLRTTIEHASLGWKAAPIYREEKVAYTDANPLLYWDDDLFGYMRAPSKRKSAEEKRDADASRVNETPTSDAITRVSPLRLSTLISIAPVSVTRDFGVMSRQDGNPVPHEHQFYRTTLKGLLSLNLNACGTFSYAKRSGYRNLDEERIRQAKEAGLEHLENAKSYRLPKAERVKRVQALFQGLALLEGGAKQALHYTDVAPALVILAVTRGGNNIFGHVVGSNGRGQPELKQEALQQALEVFGDQILSDIYIGWVTGYLDDEQARLQKFAEAHPEFRIKISHPRQAYQALVDTLNTEENSGWLD